MNHNRYITTLKSEFSSVFTQLKTHGKSNDKDRHRAEGFLHAARVLEIMSDQDIQSLMDTVHFDIFKMTIEQRKQQQKSQQHELTDEFYKLLDLPTFIREHQAG
ncbi:MAG: hypothetical protein HN790_12685 [Methylococcales bacterium]|nr:hypothetical protein [Methylococcales bacterium]